jgi:hypothetical protein
MIFVFSKGFHKKSFGLKEFNYSSVQTGLIVFFLNISGSFDFELLKPFLPHTAPIPPRRSPPPKP